MQLLSPEVTGLFSSNHFRGFEIFNEAIFWHCHDYKQGEPLFEKCFEILFSFLFQFN